MELKAEIQVGMYQTLKRFISKNLTVFVNAGWDNTNYTVSVFFEERLVATWYVFKDRPNKFKAKWSDEEAVLDLREKHYLDHKIRIARFIERRFTQCLVKQERRARLASEFPKLGAVLEFCEMFKSRYERRKNDRV